MTQFKTPEQLGISQEEFDGLVKLRQSLLAPRPSLIDSGDMIGLDRSENKGPIRAALGFMMNFGAAIVGQPAKYDCGCAACIGGHLSLLMGGADINGTCFTREALDKADTYVGNAEFRKTLGPLFFPRIIDYRDWDKISPALAAEAILNTLATGDAGWGAIGVREGFRIDEDEGE